MWSGEWRERVEMEMTKRLNPYQQNNFPHHKFTNATGLTGKAVTDMTRGAENKQKFRGMVYPERQEGLTKGRRQPSIRG